MLDEEKNDFSLLSVPLQQEIHYHIHKDLILKVPIFTHLDMKQIVWIIRRLKTDIFLPDDIIIKENEIGNEMYFISEGLAEIIIKNSDETGKDFKVTK